MCEARAGFLNMSWRGSTRRSGIPWTIQKKSSSSRYIHKQGVIMLLDNSFSTQHANGPILLPPSSVLRLPVVRRSNYSGQIILPPLAVRREAASTVLAPLRKIEYCKPFTLLSINHFVSTYFIVYPQLQLTEAARVWSHIYLKRPAYAVLSPACHQRRNHRRMSPTIQHQQPCPRAEKVSGQAGIEW